MITWKPGLAVGVDAIDDQHEEIFRRAEAADLALAEGRGEAEIDSLLAFLLGKCEVHHQEEQRFMAQVGYPGLAKHREAHQEFARRVKALERAVAGGRRGEDLAMQLSELVLGWLVTHITTDDQHLAVWLREQGQAGGAP